MLERCVELRSYVAAVLQNTGHEEYLPTQADWSAAQFLLDTLRPLKKLCDRLEHCHDVTISMVRDSLNDCYRWSLRCECSLNNTKRNSLSALICNRMKRRLFVS